MAASFSSFHSISSWSWRACSTFSEGATNQDGKYLPTTAQSGFRGGFLDEKHNNINWPCPEHCQMFQLYQYPSSIRYAETLHFSTNILFWEDLRKTLETVVLIFLKCCFDILIRGGTRTYVTSHLWTMFRQWNWIRPIFNGLFLSASNLLVDWLKRAPTTSRT